MNQSGPHVFLKARRNFALAVQTNRLQRSFVCFLTRKRSVKSPFHELESHLWKSANLEKLVQNLKEEKRAILIESPTMGTGQKGVCVRDKGLSLGQSRSCNDGVGCPVAHCSRNCICWRPRADFSGAPMLGRSRVKFQKFAKMLWVRMINGKHFSFFFFQVSKEVSDSG